MADILNYQPSKSAVYYTWARRLDPAKVLVGLLTAIVLAIIGGFCYAKSERAIFVVHFRILSTLVAAVAVGLLGLIPVKYGRVRSPVIAATIGAFLSIVALYAIWLTWLHAELHRMRFPITYHALISHPTVAVRLVKDIDKFGVWSFHGDSVAGVTAWVFWFAEGCTIVAAGVLIPIRGVHGDDPDCQDCGAQCRRVPNLMRFAVDREKEFVAAIEARDFSEMQKHPSRRHEDDPEISLRLMSCPQCRKTHVLTVNRIEWKFLPRVGRKVVITPLVNQLMITADEAEQIKSVCAEIEAQREAEQSNISTSSETE